ncbi:hypothetical protein CR513_22499, partial [Mucuna pruriens]
MPPSLSHPRIQVNRSATEEVKGRKNERRPGKRLGSYSQQDSSRRYIMVKKTSGKWCMCTYYTDLNKAYHKDPYPLPNIDRLVDGASGFALLSFIDAYLGYNQIKMHP